MHTYKVGDKVREYYDRKVIGEITEIISEDVDYTEVMVKWDKGGSVCIMDSDELVPYDPEGDKLRATHAQEEINKATHSLETAFQAWKDAQIEYAGRDGADVAYSMKQDELIDLKKFEGILNQNGWSTSSLYC